MLLFFEYHIARPGFKVKLLFLAFLLSCAPAWGAEGESVRSFKGPISRGMARNAATISARLEAMRLAVRDLAAQEQIRLFMNAEVLREVPRPDPMALGWALLLEEEVAESVSGVPPDTQSQVLLVLRLDSGAGLRPKLAALLTRPEILDYYARGIKLLELSLAGYDRAATPFLHPGVPQRRESGIEESLTRELDLAYKRLEAADGYLRLLPRLHPLEAGADIFTGNGELLDALENIGRSLPDSYLILAELGRLRLLHGHVPGARRALDAAIGLEPEFAPAYDTRGLVLLWLELPALALADFGKAISLEPYHPQFYENRALAYRILEESEKMCADLQASCRLGECAGLGWAEAQGLCAVSPARR